MDTQATGKDVADAQERNPDLLAIRRYAGMIALFCACVALFFAKEVILPFLLGILIALTLRPFTRWFSRRGIPPIVAAGLIVTAVSLFAAAGGYFLSGAVSQWIQDLPRVRLELEDHLATLSESLKSMQQVSKQVDELAETASDPEVVKVTIDQPGVVASTVQDVASFATTAVVALLLSLFLLASGDMFYVKLIESFPRLSDKKRALKIAYGVEQSISRYLLSITIINAVLGVVIGLGFWLLGMPQAAMWGLTAFLLNYLPYVGPVAGTALSAAVGLVTHETLAGALLAPGYFALVCTIEGQFITPIIVGRRLELNAVFVFATVVFWAWMWGFAGALMAVPFLVCFKVMCDNVPGLGVMGNFLGTSDMKGRFDPLRDEA